MMEDANLVATIRRGREKLHYLNPVPVHEIYERWIVKYERQRLDALHAIIDPKMTEKYWQHENISDWQAGSKWEHQDCDGKGTTRLQG